MDNIVSIDDNFIYTKLKEVVENAHSDIRKKNVKLKSDGKGFNIACPYCGDSEKRASNYRGHLNKSLKYKCFNCSRRATFLTLCKDFEVKIDYETKRDLYKFIDSTVKINNIEIYENSDIELENLLDIDEVCRSINTNPSIKLKDIKPLQFGSKQHYYVHEIRKFPNDIASNIYQAFYIKGKYYEPVILFMNKKNNSKELLAFQVRNLKDGDDRWFKVYSYTELYNICGIDNISDDELFILNKISYFFNILNVDFNKPITVLESYQDSIFYPNSIGAVGTNTDFTFFDVSELDVKYMFDNDNTGYYHSALMLKKNKKVFLWMKLFDSIISMKNPKDPYIYKTNLLKIKDLDKLNQFAPNAYKRFNLENFFSSDIYDIKYIPKYIFKNTLKKT